LNSSVPPEAASAKTNFIAPRPATALGAQRRLRLVTAWQVSASEAPIGLRRFGGEAAPPAASFVADALYCCSQLEQEMAMALGDEIDEIFRREVKSLPAYAKAQGAAGSGVAPPVDEMNQLLMGLAVAAQQSFHVLADRIDELGNA